MVSTSELMRRLSAAFLAAVLMAGAMVPAAGAKQTASPKPLLPEARAVMNDPEFQWTPVPGATSYRLEVALDHNFTEIVHTIDTPATRYMDTAAWPAASYWWRVKAIAPFESAQSPVRSFTRRWIGPDGGGGSHQETARPDNVTVEDFSADPGVQVPANALKISWEPVAGASHYEVQFDGMADKVCTTPHTVLTPYLSGSLGSAKGATSCDPKLDNGTHWVRVRAVDDTPGDTALFSLWSDEARTLDSQVPAPAVFTQGPDLSGSADLQPAVLTNPRNGTVFMDVPTFEWRPVSWATEYELVVALDQDFTNVLGRFRTKNTRLVPLQRLPENTAIRSYYWYVVPCQKVDKTTACLNENRAVNREGRFRSFKKQSVLVRPKSVQRRGTPWVEFSWEPYSATMYRFARKTDTWGASIGGIQWYEFQIKSRGAGWDTARTTVTDLPGVLPVELQFGGRFQWRVRPVDESGMGRPWSEVRSLRMPLAVPDNPVALRAFRKTPTRISLRWRTPKSQFFPVTGYSVYFSSRGTRWRPLTQVPRTRAAFKVGKGQRYWFMVTATNYAGEGPPSRVFVPR